jgi:large subunit ribosomal protein L29
MKASELKNMAAGELQTQLEDLLKEQFNLRMQKGVGQLSRPSQMKSVRRDIARIKTVLTEMKAGSEK